MKVIVSLASVGLIAFTCAIVILSVAVAHAKEEMEMWQ